MQLFGLVNTLLASDRETSKSHLVIQRYAVIPLSPNSGLIGWVPHCDTLHALITNYRQSRRGFYLFRLLMSILKYINYLDSRVEA